MRAVAPDFPGANRGRGDRGDGEPGRRPRQLVREPARVHVRRRPVVLPPADARRVPGQAARRRRSSTSRRGTSPTRRSHAFTLAEGHKIALHSYEHPRLTNLSPNGLRFQIEGAAALMQPGLLPVLRAPFGGTNASVNEAAASMGFAGDGTGAVGHAGLRPGPHGRADPRRDPRRAAAGARDRAPRRADRHRRRAATVRGDGDDHRRGAGARLLLRRRRRDRTRGRGPLRRVGTGDPADHELRAVHPARLPGHTAVAVGARAAAAAGGRGPLPCRVRPRRHRHDHADRVEPDDRHADRRQPDGRHARDARRADGDQRGRRRAGRAAARRRSRARG